jgi:hypothetical protein
MMKHHECLNVNSTTARNISIYNTSAAYTTLGRTNINPYPANVENMVSS